MTAPSPIPHPFLGDCGCIFTTQAVLYKLGLFDKRIEVVVVTTFCPRHREQYRGQSSEERSTYRTNCSLCIFYFSMAMIALAGWIATAIMLWRSR